jgi:SAM-dependent methyltransferase
MAEIEDRHWWFAGRRRILQAAIKRLVELKPGAKILDAGCGTGGNLEVLFSLGDLVGMEVDPGALEIAKQKAIAPVYSGRLPDRLPFPEESFDLIVLLDVLEHLDDDEAAVQSLAGLLKPGGSLLLTVPAFSFLWSAHDESHHHRRRYRISEVSSKIKKAGLDLRYASYFNTWLFPLIALIRLLKPGRRSADISSDDLSLPPFPVNRMLAALFGSESYFIGRLSFPAGISVMACARRPG